MYSTSDWRKALTKLLELTSRGSVKWTASEKALSDESKRVVSAFETVLNDKLFVVYEVTYQRYIDEFEWYWAKDYVLEVFDYPLIGDVSKIAAAPEISTLPSLFSAAEDSYAFSKSALGGLLE